ncbi:hypothetical protein C923_00916 [Plasmodium falciparum UGT5.1]|uniref:Uncharacterized protein n=1 Tax=Plasmodium falciparum UGT5.1 TaxID=1237627 RepID=W7K3D1_PLAFA|nr:hypothetical protein C923_00916 [Plasmodium falciparum UGT5.1]
MVKKNSLLLLSNDYKDKKNTNNIININNFIFYKYQGYVKKTHVLSLKCSLIKKLFLENLHDKYKNMLFESCCFHNTIFCISQQASKLNKDIQMDYVKMEIQNLINNTNINKLKLLTSNNMVKNVSDNIKILMSATRSPLFLTFKTIPPSLNQLLFVHPFVQNNHTQHNYININVHNIDQLNIYTNNELYNQQVNKNILNNVTFVNAQEFAQTNEPNNNQYINNVKCNSYSYVVNRNENKGNIINGMNCSGKIMGKNEMNENKENKENNENNENTINGMNCSGKIMGKNENNENKENTTNDMNCSGKIMEENEMNEKEDNDEEKEKTFEDISYIYKVNDDVRQDKLVIQTIYIFIHILNEYKLCYNLFPYNIITNKFVNIYSSNEEDEKDEKKWTIGASQKKEKKKRKNKSATTPKKNNKVPNNDDQIDDKRKFSFSFNLFKKKRQGKNIYNKEKGEKNKEKINTGINVNINNDDKINNMNHEVIIQNDTLLNVKNCNTHKDEDKIVTYYENEDSVTEQEFIGHSRNMHISNVKKKKKKKNKFENFGAVIEVLTNTKSRHDIGKKYQNIIKFYHLKYSNIIFASCIFFALFHFTSEG